MKSRQYEVKKNYVKEAKCSLESFINNLKYYLRITYKDLYYSFLYLLPNNEEHLKIFYLNLSISIS